MAPVTVIASCFVPYPAVSSANRAHQHWRKQKERADEQKAHTWAAIRALPLETKSLLIAAPEKEPLLVRLIVISAHAMDPDNLKTSTKYYQDEVARWLGVNDRDETRVRYVTKWERYRGKGLRGVRIEFVRYLDHLLEEKARIEADIASLSGVK